MSAQSDRSHTAQIVDIVGLLDSSVRKRITTAPELREPATLLSIRQNLRYRACMGVDDIDTLSRLYTPATASKLVNHVRELLNTEFGQLRVHRYRRAFTVGHHSLEGLISGLLRVQYHARNFELPAMSGHDQPCDWIGLSLSWGVGDSVVEADNERLRRRRLKR